MSRFNNLFHTVKPYIIGMIHINALPGTPNACLSINQLIDQALKEVEIYKLCNIDSVLMENMHDVPYIQPDLMGPEITACMTKICSEIRNFLPSSMPCGVQVLAGGNKEAVAVAQAANLQFIRAEGYVFTHIADEGIMNSCAGELLRYRKSIGADNICIFADIKKKHCSHAITSDISLEEIAKAAEFFLSDGVVLTGKETGNAPDISEFKRVRKMASGPVLIGSGVDEHNFENYIEADAIIMGSHFKKDGSWKNEVDVQRVQNFIKLLNEKKAKLM